MCTYVYVYTYIGTGLFEWDVKFKLALEMKQLEDRVRQRLALQFSERRLN